MRILDSFPTVEAFVSLVDQAKENAKNNWERGFLANLSKRYKTYGTQSYLSESQLTVLEKIANGKSYKEF